VEGRCHLSVVAAGDLQVHDETVIAGAAAGGLSLRDEIPGAADPVRFGAPDEDGPVRGFPAQPQAARSYRPRQDQARC
jgi:hypothetical protein